MAPQSPRHRDAHQLGRIDFSQPRQVAERAGLVQLLAAAGQLRVSIDDAVDLWWVLGHPTGPYRSHTRALVDAVHAALVAAFQIPDEDKHMRLVVQQPHRF